MKLFAVYDKIGEDFVSLFWAKNRDSAHRSIRMAFKDKDPAFNDGLVLIHPHVLAGGVATIGHEFETVAEILAGRVSIGDPVKDFSQATSVDPDDFEKDSHF